MLESKGQVEIPDAAILFLPRPPLDCNYSKWYSKPVAGLSFLKRNLLELNEAGLGNCIVFSPEASQEEIHSLSEILNNLQLSNPQELKTNRESLNDFLSGNKNAVFINGSYVHSHRDLKIELSKDATGNDDSAYSAAPLTAKDLQQWNRSFAEFVQTGENEDGYNFPFAKLLFLKSSPPIEKESDFEWHSNRLIRSSGLGNDSFLDRTVTRRISNALTRFIVRTPLTPNAITAISLAIGLASAICFLQGGFWPILAGAIILQISAWVDCVDGEIARLKFMKSEIGAEFDILCDNIVHISVFFCLGMGLYFETGNAVYKTFGAFAVMGNLLSFALLGKDIIKGKAKADSVESHAKATQKKQEEPPEIANRDFTYYLIGFSMFGLSSWFLAMTAIGSNVFAGYLIYKRRKRQAD